MCIICTDWIKGLLTTTEAKRNLQEMTVVIDPKHVEEVKTLLNTLPAPKP